MLNKLMDTNIAIIRTIKEWHGEKIIGSLVIFKVAKNALAFYIKLGDSVVTTTRYIEPGTEIQREAKLLKNPYKLAWGMGYDLRWNGKGWRLLHKFSK